MSHFHSISITGGCNICHSLALSLTCVVSSRAPNNSSTVIHLLPLPHHSKADGVRFRWTQEAPQGPEGYESCWGLDNVLLVNAAHRPPLLEDNLDPPNTANWLFFPGATVKVHHSISRHYSSNKTQVSFLSSALKCKSNTLVSPA